MPSWKDRLRPLKGRLLDLLARVVVPLHPTNKSGNNASTR